MQFRVADANSFTVLGDFTSQAQVASFLLSVVRYETQRVVLNGIIYVLTLTPATNTPYVIPG
jgi:hypothetical protein